MLSGMPERENLYRVLQVDPAASSLVIQAAYRVLARIFHPDLEGDDEQMKRLNHAWAVLGDPRRRAEYDRQLAGRHPGPSGSHAGSGIARPMSASYAATASTHAASSATAAHPGAPPRQADHAGPPQGEPSGPMLTFGRYDGWTIGQVARVDPPFLEWLRRVPAGRQLEPDQRAACVADAPPRRDGLDELEAETAILAGFPALDGAAARVGDLDAHATVDGERLHEHRRARGPAGVTDAVAHELRDQEARVLPQLRVAEPAQPPRHERPGGGRRTRITRHGRLAQSQRARVVVFRHVGLLLGTPARLRSDSDVFGRHSVAWRNRSSASRQVRSCREPRRS
jgi:curved DNA-binding protein CbpA